MPSLMAVGIALFSLGLQSYPQASNRAKDEEDIREAVFRRFIEIKPTMGEHQAAAFFLSVDGGDPSEELISRFKGQVPPVLPQSAGDLYVPVVKSNKKSDEQTILDSSNPDDKFLKDRKTGRFAMSFGVGKIIWLSETKAEVKASYYCGVFCAAGYTVSLKKENGRWKVEKGKVDVVARSFVPLVHSHAPLAPGFPPFEIAG